MSTKAEIIEYLKKVPDDEPLFLLRAQDALAVDLVEMWAIRAKSGGTPTDKTNEAMNVAQEMLRYPVRKHPD